MSHFLVGILNKVIYLNIKTLESILLYLFTHTLELQVKFFPMCQFDS